MERSDFVRAIFKFCQKDDADLMRTYDLALSVNKPIDWSKLYNICITEMKNRYLPAPSYFIELFNRCIISEELGGKYDGIKLRVVLKNTTYDYETFNNNSTVYELKQSAKRKWKDKLISFQVFNEETLKWQAI